MRAIRVIILFNLFLLASVTSGVQKNPPASAELNDILNRMAVHEEWQIHHLVEYEVNRKFYAANARFNLESVLEVKTRFKRPNTFESEVLHSEGSSMIRERVFDKILDAEKEVNSNNQGRQEVKITPDNYNFELIGRQDCDGRPCYNLEIRPKQKSKYSVNGYIWVDAEDGAIVRLQGSPAKRPSFWTLDTEIERRYARVDGVWLCEAMESSSNVFLGGPSTLKIDYNYVGVQTEGKGDH
jgi:hypothetical protein